MSDGDRTQGERITSLEDVGQERKEDIAAWRATVEKRFDQADGKLDQLLKNGKNLVTIEVMKDSFTAHVTSCPGRTMAHNPGNPGPKNSDDKNSSNKWVDQALKGWRALGIVGSLVALNGMLIVVVMKQAGVF